MHDVRKEEGRFSDTSIKYSNMLAYYGTDFFLLTIPRTLKDPSFSRKFKIG
jgi:hypothetical protein